MKLKLLFILFLTTHEIQCQNEVEFMPQVDIMSKNANYQKQIIKLDVRNNENYKLLLELNDLLDIIVEQIIISLIKLTKFKNDIIKVGTEEVTKTTNDLEKLSRDALEKIDENTNDELKDKTKVCLGKSRELIPELLENYTSNLKTCVDEKVDKIIQIEKVIFQQILRLGDISQDFISESEKCLLKPAEADECIKSAIVDAFNKIFDVMFEIAFEVVRAVFVFPRTKDDIRHCGIRQVDDLTFDLNSLFKECFKSSSVTHRNSIITYVILIFNILFIYVIS